MKNIRKSYKHLDQFDRDRIEALLKRGHTQKDIAEVLGVNKSTISRELGINKLERDGVGFKKAEYKAVTAQRKSKQRRVFAKYQGKKIEEDEVLKIYVIEGLKKHWNPDEISGRMRSENKPFYASKTAIYTWLYSSYGQRYCKYLSSKRYDLRKQAKKGKRIKKVLIPNRIGIEMRPEYINNRSVGGHFEADTIISGKKTRSKAVLVVASDRKFRYTKIEKIKNMKPSSFNQAILGFKDNLKIQSLTLDNGIENQDWKQLDLVTFFCDPYSSWQKGGIENINKMIRKHIPKGCDINNYSDEYIKKVENILNNKPRKILNYMTPLEAMKKANLIIKKQKTFDLKVALRG